MLNGRTKGAFGAKRADSGHSAPLAYVSARIAGREVPAERDAVGGLGLRHLENAAQPRDRTAKPKCFISAVVVECRNLPTELEFQRIHQPRLSAQVFKKTLPLPPSFNHATPLSHVVTVRTLVRRNNAVNSRLTTKRVFERPARSTCSRATGRAAPHKARRPMPSPAPAPASPG